MQKLSVYLESTDRWIQQEPGDFWDLKTSPVVFKNLYRYRAWKWGNILNKEVPHLPVQIGQALNSFLKRREYPGIVKIGDVIKSSKKSECSELDQLCDLLTSVDSFLCRCSVEALVALTEDGIVPLRKTVDVLQASVAPNSCCDSLLWGLTEAVRMTLTSSGSVTSSVGWAGHPHLVAMRAAPQYWRSVAQQFQRLMMITHKSQYWSNVLQYCTSFLNSCFKSVPPEVSARDLRVNIANTFCRAAGATHSAEPLIHLLHAISSVQVDSAWSVDLEIICDNLLNWAEQQGDQSALSAFTLMLVHCLHLQSNSDRVISTSLSDRLCQLFDAGMGGDLELVLLSHVLYRSTALSLRHGPLVAAVSSLVSSGRCSPCVAALLAPPLLRAISTLPTLSSSLSPLLRAALQCRRGASTVASSPLRHAVFSVHPSVAEADLLLKTFAADVDADCQQKAWLSHVSSLVERGGSLSQLCWRGVCALLLCPAVSSSLRSSALSLSAAHVQSCPARAADLNHCLRHRLSAAHRVIDVGSEWRTFSNDRNAADPSRIGGPENNLLSSDLSTMIGESRGAASFSMDGQAKYQNRRQISSSDRALTTAFREISSMADRISLPKTIIDRANTLFKQVHDDQSLKGRANDAITSACLYVASRQEGEHRTFKEICAVSKGKKKEIGRCFKDITRSLETNVEMITTEDFMSRFCANLRLPNSVQRAATYIARRAACELDIVPGRSPISVAASAIYMASQVSEEKRTQKEIGDIAGLADVTICQSYKLMLPYASELFPKDFKFHTPIDDLPQL